MPEPEQNVEMGLGLTDFISGGDQKTEDSPESTQKEKPPEVNEQKLDEAPKKESSEKVEAKAEDKVEEKKEEKKEDQQESKAEKEEVKPVDTEVSTDWESDLNPYKKRHLDAGSWANQTHQENLNLKKEMEILGKKFDGTYDPEEEAKNAPSAEKIAEDAKTEGKITASRGMAADIYGSEKAEKLLDSFTRIFEGNQLVNLRVVQAEAPALEAIKVLKEHVFFTKYGNDPEKIITSIKEEMRKELTQQIRKEESDKFDARLKKKDEVVEGLANVNGAAKVESSKEVSGPEPLNKIFDNF